MFDLIIKDGTVIDGTGSPGIKTDIALLDGKISDIGSFNESEAKEVVNAENMMVCPGFIDPHTHYDAQLFWDPYASPSNLHGVTSVVMGNCGFSIAPISDSSDAEYLGAMLVQVEGMSAEALRLGVDWEWNSFEDYLERLDGKIGVNVAAMVGHCALRRTVMKEDAVKREATEDEIAKMQQLLGEALEAGGLGFSTSRSFTHTDGDGLPVPSRVASVEEVLALAEVCEKYPGTTLEWVADGCLNGFSDEEVELMAQMSLRARRPLNWNVLTVDSARPDDYRNQINACERVAEKGGKAMALTMPILVGMTMHFHSYCALYKLPGWDEIMTLPVDEKKQKLADPSIRKVLEEKAASPEAGVFSRLTGWGKYRIGETFSDENKGLDGRLVSDIARERGNRDFYTLLDIVLADDLKTVLWPGPTDDDPASWLMRQTIWDHEEVMIGGSDAGAHLDRMAGASYPTEWIRDCLSGRKLTSIERAIEHMTDVPAKFFGLVDRGRIEKGFCADLVIFNPDQINSQELKVLNDLPGESPRLYGGAEGIEKVFVNGVLSINDGKPTESLSGIVLRSGTHTVTNPIPADDK